MSRLITKQEFKKAEEHTLIAVENIKLAIAVLPPTCTQVAELTEILSTLEDEVYSLGSDAARAYFRDNPLTTSLNSRMLGGK